MLVRRLSNDIVRQLSSLRVQNYKASAAQIKELRELSGCGIAECKKALELNQGDKNKSMDYLKEKGLASAKQRQSKQTLEGMIGLKRTGNGCILLEINCETDFVARCDMFVEFMKVVMKGLDENRGMIGQQQLSGDALQQILQNIKIEHEVFGEQGIIETQQLLISKIKENIQIRRVEIVQKEQQESLGVYVHNSVDKEAEIGQQVCLSRLGRQQPENKMHLEIADNMALMYLGNQPQFIYRSEVSPEIINKQEETIKEQMKDAMKNKPEQVVRKMLDGKISKFYQDIVMMDMHYFLDVDRNITIDEYLKEQQKSIDDEVMLGPCKIWRVGQDLV